MRYRGVAVGLLIGVALAGCETLTTPGVDSTFAIEVSGERFHIRTDSEAVVAQLEQRRRDGIEGVISGELLPGDGGFNTGWSWHLDPATVHVPDLAIELCDGRPSMVEDDLPYWLQQVEAFCPWGATVIGTVP